MSYIILSSSDVYASYQCCLIRCSPFLVNQIKELFYVLCVHRLYYPLPFVLVVASP